ncbi:MAG: hypothetical protein AB9835_00845 [Eubacteriales bacterium]
MNHRIDFDSLPWIEPAQGVRYKLYNNGRQKFRYVVFSYGLTEEDWCRKAHTGYVIDGSFSVDYSGSIEQYVKGDVFVISRGEEDRHMAVLGDNESVTLLLIEPACE